MKTQKNIIRLISVLIVAALIIAIFPTQKVRAAAIVVDSLADVLSSDAYCTLQEAIKAATLDTAYMGCSAGSGDDVITFSVSGTIELASPLSISYPATPQALTINGGNNIIIDGEGSKVITNYNGDTTIENIEFTDGTTGIDLDGGSLTLTNVALSYFSTAIQVTTTSTISVTDGQFDHNSRGITNINGSLYVYTTTFEDNSGDWAISNSGTLEVSGSTFNNNSSTNPSPGINNHGTATVTGSTFSNNSIVSPGNNVVGGAIANCAGDLTVSDSIFDNNSVSGEWAAGGAISQGNCSDTDVVVIEDSLFINNSVTGASSANGGALFLDEGIVTLTNLTIQSNSAASGGAIDFHNSAGELVFSLTNSTIKGNTSTGYLASNVYCSSSCSSFNNNIFANSAVGSNCGYQVSGLPSNNISTDSSCDGASVVTEAELALGTLGDYGGPTPTIPLLPGSVAIENGDNGTCTSADQRGISRPQGGVCDVGAYESRRFTLVKTGGDSQSTLVDTSFSNPLTLSINSSFSEPVNGGQITFTAPAIGASTTFAPTATGTISGGAASLPATANWFSGSYLVEADASGAAAPLSYNLTNTGSDINNVGFYVPGDMKWYLKLDQTDGWTDYFSFKFGGPSDWNPVTGDWDSDGKDTAGFYMASKNKWYLKNSQDNGWTSIVDFKFGCSHPDWVPVAGDWDNDGEDTAGFYVPATGKWYLKNDQIDGWTNFIGFKFQGPFGAVPVVGDWNNDGVDSIGFYVPSGGKWYLKDTLFSGWYDYVAVKFAGPSGAVPVTGDWDGDGDDTIGFYVPSGKKWYLKNDLVDGWSGVDPVKFGGPSGWQPVTGDWQ